MKLELHFLLIRNSFCKIVVHILAFCQKEKIKEGTNNRPFFFQNNWLLLLLLFLLVFFGKFKWEQSRFGGMPPVAECQHFLCSKRCFPRRYKNYADYIHGVHRPGKPGRLRKFKNLSVSWETQGNSNFYGKKIVSLMEKSGKRRIQYVA